jgi:hypothetical protein
MTRVTVDQSTGAKLQAMDQGSEICDPAGHVLGFFWPVTDRSLYDVIEVPFTEAELDDAESEGGGRPLADILRDLEKRS